MIHNFVSSTYTFEILLASIKNLWVTSITKIIRVDLCVQAASTNRWCGRTVIVGATAVMLRKTASSRNGVRRKVNDARSYNGWRVECARASDTNNCVT
jgi:hypothetical protein